MESKRRINKQCLLNLFCDVNKLFAVVILLFAVFSQISATDPQEDNMRERKLNAIRANEGIYDPMTSKIAPDKTEVYTKGDYGITKTRLDEIRKYLMYPYFDTDISGGDGDLESSINLQNTQLNKQLTFLLPFYGFGLNYTWISLNGYLGFSDAPFNWDHYPLSFPVEEWPSKPDPSFIGPFYSRCNIGQLRPEDKDQRTPGVYWRLERDLPTRTDQFAVELRERLKWDIREGMVGAEIFNPKHLIIVTWKNVTFAGGYLNSQAKHVTNTFQLLVTTDEIRTYAVFNYEHMVWTSHTEAGGSSDDGNGGTPAFVGFNAGNGTSAFEYTPYSQSLYIRDLAIAGMANGKPGRHIFRIDEKILPGCCRREETLKSYPATFSPEHGNMMGGTLVNVTGPCFDTSFRITCQFDTEVVEGFIKDSNTATCIMPRLFVNGYRDFSISVNGGPFYWGGRFFVETPLTAPEGVWFRNEDDTLMQKEQNTLEMHWLSGNLTQTYGATVNIYLYGYRERSITPDIIFIDTIGEGISNDNREKYPYTINTEDFASRRNDQFLDIEMGMIMINLTDPEPVYGLKTSTQVWSRPIPLGWFFRFQWETRFGKDWPVAMCDRWIENDRNLRNFAYEVERCPCLLTQAIADRGRFLPDFGCDMDANSECKYHPNAIHCVRTALPNKDGGGQQCCYDREGYLMLSSDKIGGGTPHRAHNLGKMPYDEANKVPSLSHWYHDVIPYFECCVWQNEQSPGCTTFRFERRSSQDCVGYQPPSAGTVFGDPHFYTFDDVQYTFNGKGEFVLVRVNSNRHVLDIQGRFEQIEQNYLGFAQGSVLTAVAAGDNISSVVEIRRRPLDAMWRYHLDVIVDEQKVYFDRYSQKIQQFKECVVYTPSNILNQSHVVVMFTSGAGIEVIENKGYLATRVYLPLSFANITRGLLGNWTFDPEDDFMLPDGTEGATTDFNDFKKVHDDFAMQWVIDDKEDEKRGKSLFTHQSFRSSNYFYDATFKPEWEVEPDINPNATLTPVELKQICGDSYQCNYDFVVSLRREMAVMTKYYQDQFVNIKQNGLKSVTACGALPTPPNGRKSTFNFLSGAEVKFDCDVGFVLLGEQRRWCYSSGDWNWPEDGEAQCVTENEYNVMKSGIVAGTVLAVLVPVLIALMCYASYVRSKRHRTLNENGSWEVPQNPDRKQSLSARISNSFYSIYGRRNETPNGIGFVQNSGQRRKVEEHPAQSEPSAPYLESSVMSSFLTPRNQSSKETPIGLAEDPGQRRKTNETTVQSLPSKKPQPLKSLKKRLKGSPMASDYSSEGSQWDSTGVNQSQLESDENEYINHEHTYDGEYFTNEPLNDKPCVFQNTEWDLGSDEVFTNDDSSAKQESAV